ncbi:hypothetical protein N7507_008536 [Penicillium longicatenatum]|nr:hypothetical protein N7507_008536 [Penicillium longicatenatum]
MGKVGARGEFHRSGSLIVLRAVNMMRAAELTDDPRYPEYLHRAIRRTKRTRKNFDRPGAQRDRLFRLEYDHSITASNCDGCLEEWEETRGKREPYYGIIASGNSVIKDGRTWE